MRKRDELRGPSCMTNALDDEMVFVLLGRDRAAPLAIRMWCEARIALGLNHREDEKIVEAFKAAETMELEGDRMRAVARGRAIVDTTPGPGRDG